MLASLSFLQPDVVSEEYTVGVGRFTRKRVELLGTLTTTTAQTRADLIHVLYIAELTSTLGFYKSETPGRLER